VSYIKCANKSVTAEDINRQVWDIIDTIAKNLHVIEELGDMIKLSAIEPEQHGGYHKSGHIECLN